MLAGEGANEQGVKVETLAQHPGVISEEKVVEDDVQEPARYLKIMGSAFTGYLARAS